MTEPQVQSQESEPAEAEAEAAPEPNEVQKAQDDTYVAALDNAANRQLRLLDTEGKKRVWTAFIELAQTRLSDLDAADNEAKTDEEDDEESDDEEA